MLEIESFDQANQVGSCSAQHQDMEDLVRATPDVKAARPNAFGKSGLRLVNTTPWTLAAGGLTA